MSPETLLRRAALAAAVLCAACQQPAAADPKMVSEWMHSLYGAVRVERLSPPVASRLTAYASAALYSGLAAADPALEPLAGWLNGFPELPRATDPRAYDATSVAVAAERVVLDSLLGDALPTTRAALTRLADSLARSRESAGVLSAVRTRSDELGTRIGAAIVTWARGDGFDGKRVRPPYVPPAGDAYWVNDAPLNTYAAQNLSGASELVAPDNPGNLMRAGAVSDRSLVLNRPKLASAKSLPPVNMAGTAEPYWGTVRPFVVERWDACPVPEPPPYATDSTATLYRDAYNLIRPRTYIRRVIDSTWEPLIPTPPFPEYPSGHSTVSAAAAETMVALLGDGAFDDSTGLAIGHPVRRFDSFRAAAHEAGQSRVYAGIHFTFGNLGGRELGECIGAKVVQRLGGDRRE